MKFLIEAGTFPENEASLCEVLNEMKIEYSIWNPDGRPHYKSNDNHVFFIGQIHSALALKRAGARFQIWLGPEFDYTYFGAHLNNLLNNEIVVMPYGAILREYEANKIKYDESYDRNHKLFFRSNSGYKKFQGGLYNQGEFLEEAKRVNLFKEELLFAAEKKKIEAEYRMVIRSEYNEVSDLWAHKVVTYSSYPDNNVPALNDNILKNIEDDLNTSTYHPYPMWILDVALCNGKFYELETNSLNTSGLYQCDLRKIVEEILEVERKEIV